MTLTDAGPLVALLDRDDRHHAQCAGLLSSLSAPLVTSWPAFTEAMYLIARGGWAVQSRLWDLVLRGDLQIKAVAPDGLPRVRDLMERYRDTPMDLADASLVVVANALGLRRIFTLDRHFAVFRDSAGRPFELVPA